MESATLKAKGSAHKSCPLDNKVVSMGIQVNKSETGILKLNNLVNGGRWRPCFSLLEWEMTTEGKGLE